MKIKLIFLFLLSITPIIWGSDKESEYKKLFKTTAIDSYNYIDINQILMWISNFGLDSYNPRADGPGLYWRRGENLNHTMAYFDGLFLGGIVNKDVRVIGTRYFSGMQPGKIFNDGVSDNPAISKYRVYKLSRNWMDLPPGELKASYQKDFDEWPVEDGAPWIDKNQNGRFDKGIDEPELLGDETLWFVCNDLNSSINPLYFNTKPLGLEIQCTVFGFELTNVMGRTVIKKYKIINKGKNDIQNMHFGYWSDPEIGNGEDDYVGCDSILNLGFSYNWDNMDNYFGPSPPAIGYLLLQGPIAKGFVTDSAKFNGRWLKNFYNLPMTSFWPLGLISESTDSLEMVSAFYNYLKGKTRFDSTIINQVTHLATNYVFSGDPESGEGWLDNGVVYHGVFQENAKFMFSSGPVNMAPADTQEFVIGIIVSNGKNNLNSVTELKKDTKLVQYFYNHYTQEYDIIKTSSEYFYLDQNYPNPFNSSTTIKYSIPEVGTRHILSVQLKVYDVLGREVAILVNESKPAGDYEFKFDGSNLASGIYFYRIEANEFIKCKKMLVLK